MNLEQQPYGYADWHLPSPSQTPTSTTFSSSSFVTPKINKFSSHFQDNFTTPSSGGQHTPVQTSNPFDYQSTPAAKPAGSGGQRRISFDDPGFHHNHVTADKGLQLPPVEITRRLSSSPNTPIEPQGESQLTQYPGPTLEGLAINNMDPTQMQTPPPTRDSSRRKTQQAYSAALNTPTIASRRTVAPSPSVGSHIPSAQIQPSPFALQFSPDMYQFSNTGPATAPVYSRTRPMWGQKDVLSSMNVEWSSAFDDPFMMPPQQSTDQSTWQDLSSPIHNQPSMPVPHTTSFPETTMAHPASSQWPQQARRDESYSQNTSLVEASPVTTGVNPSLLMSFSGHHSDPLFPETLEATLGADETRQPYAQQSQEFKRDQEAEQSVVARQHTRTSTSSSSGSLRSNFRPGLGRSNTIGGFKSVGRPTISTEDQISRTSSPLKRQSQGTLSSIPERRKSQRRSVVLTVDANGRASTETKLFPNVNLSEPRQRYPSLWDDSSSDSNSEDDADMTNRYSSTAFERSSERPRPAANSDIKDVSAIPRTSSASSNHAPWCSHNTSQASSNRVSWGSNASRRQSDSMNSSSQEDIGREDISRMDNSSGNAHSALREAMEGRVRKNEANNSQRMLDVQNKRWARLSADLKLHSPNLQQSNISPTTILDSDLTPSTDGHSLMSDTSTRCLCGTTTEIGDQLMVQCESCSYWLHVQCLGLNKTQLPPVYVCMFCTGQTPVVRGGRIREPTRSTNPFSSPLEQKVGRRR